MLGALSRAADRIGGEPAFQILTYHRVNDDDDPFLPAVPTQVFKAQIRHISKTYTVLPVDALVDCMNRGRLPRNAIAITFDDGYRDNLTHAAPIVARHGVPATIFLATGYIASTSRPWFDEVAVAFKTTRVTMARMPWGSLELHTQVDRLATLNQAWAWLKSLPEDEFDEGFHRILEALAPYHSTPNGHGANGMLDWDDVKVIAGLGFSLGAHTVSHPILSRVTTGRARREIEDCRDMIRAATGTAPRAFAYPNGAPADYTDDVLRLVRQAGFTCAVTARFGVNTGRTSPWELRRGGPWEHHLPTFALKLAGYRLLRA